MAEQTADQKDAAKLEHQAHAEHREGKHPAGFVKQTESKLGKHRDLIIVSISLLSLIIAFSQWRGHSAKKAAAAADAAASSTDPAADPSILDGTGNSYVGTSGNGPTGGYVSGSDGSSGAAAGDTSSADLTSALTNAISAQQAATVAAINQARVGQSTYLANISHELAQMEQSLKWANKHSAIPPKLTVHPKPAPPVKKVQPVRKKK